MKSALTLLFLLSYSVSIACTTFSIPASPTKVVGKSYDWSQDHGYIIANPKFMEKRAYPLAQKNPATWTSEYGSLTFNQYGREFPLGGINEEGLVVEIMQLASTQYPDVTTEATLNELQWIQYQLDSYKLVSEMVRNKNKILIGKLYADVHYLACDKTGECATFEFFSREQGKAEVVVRSRETLPVPVLTNNTYDSSIKELKQYTGFGGDLALPKGPGSLERFVIASFRSRFFPTGQDAVPYAFAALQEVRNGWHTKWNMVYESAVGKVHYRTIKHPEIKSFAISDFSFDCRKPAKIYPIQISAQGDIGQEFIDYTTSANQAMLVEALKIVTNLPTGALESLAAYPQNKDYMQCKPR